MSHVVLKNIYKKYSNELNAVSDFNLDIGDEEFIVLVGPSGCGKSTTLRMIAGLEEISEGEIYIDDVCINNMEPKDRDIAMVFQNYALYPHMSVFENMAFGLKIRKMPKNDIEKKVLEVANILGLQDTLKRKPRELSGGQRQRVAIGRAMVRAPKVFLMDEPLSNLDAKLRVQMRIEIAKLHKKLKTTFIYVTHDQIEAMTLGTKIVVMNNGIIQQVATPGELYSNPTNMFVASFIGSPQMNFINGIVRQSDISQEIYIECKGKKIEVRQDKKHCISNYINQEIIMGVRPDYINIYVGDNSNVDGIICDVEMVENMGAEKYVHLKYEENIIIAKYTGEDNISSDSRVCVKFNNIKINYFDKISQRAI